MKKIAIFSHKGGVSKTTTAFHLGWSLAQQKKNVLLVDTDAQCNLTEYAMGYNRYAAYYAEKRENINDCLRPAYQSEPKTIQPAECCNCCAMSGCDFAKVVTFANLIGCLRATLLIVVATRCA